MYSRSKIVLSNVMGSKLNWRYAKMTTYKYVNPSQNDFIKSIKYTQHTMEIHSFEKKLKIKNNTI